MRALSIRQPYAELILRGIKTVEYRTQPTRIVGQRFHIYAPLKKASADLKDALTQIGLWRDDAQIVDCHTQKSWSERGGASVLIESIQAATQTATGGAA